MSNNINLILFIITFFIIIKIQCQQFPSVSCPHIFNYVFNPQNGLAEGRIKITDTRPGVNIVSVKMSYSKDVAFSSRGQIGLIIDKRQIAAEVNKGHPLIYRVIFPTTDVVPIIKEIKSNGRIICSNRVHGGGARNVIRTHRLNAPNIISLAASNNPSPNTRRPKPNVPTSTLSADCGTTAYPSNLIYGGQKTTPGKWPWLVAIFLRNKYICGGTIVSSYAIITAAHCIVEGGRQHASQDVLIGLGIYNIYNWNEPNTHIARVSRIISHPEYSRKSIYDADIAIIILDKSYSYNYLIRPVCMWSGSSDLNAVLNRIARVSGWGQARINGGTESEPNILNTQIVTTEKCLRSNEVYASVTSERNLCAGYRNGKGPCKGDSGSGLMLDIGGRWYLRAVVSGSLRHATTTCDLKEYVIYTDVAKFLNWIRSHIIHGGGARTVIRTHRLKAPNITPLAVSNNPNSNTRGPKPNVPSSTLSVDCGTTVYPTNLIYGGQKTTPGKWPWLVAIFLRNKYICAGTIVSPYAIITAAHCIVEGGRLYALQDVLIGLGLYNLYNWNEPNTHIARVSRIISHPEYKRKSIYDADISIIIMDKSYSYNHLIRPVCMWSGSSDLKAVINRNALVSGWGQALINGNTDSEPNIINTQIVTTKKCLRSNEVYASVTSERNLCAGYRNGMGPCTGDSGSGLILDIGGRWHLRGLVSGVLRHATTSCDRKEYVIYTDVAKFLNWIRSHISY